MEMGRDWNGFYHRITVDTKEEGHDLGYRGQVNKKCTFLGRESKGFWREVSKLICSGNSEQAWSTEDNSIGPRVRIHFSFLEIIA
jgi:hypothetical protein